MSPKIFSARPGMRCHRYCFFNENWRL